MRIALIHPNYHSGGAEIAGNWPPAWVAYLAGHLKDAGFNDIHFIDAMTNHLSDDELRVRLRELQPDVVGVTAITPSIYTAENVLKIASEEVPNAVRVLGGIHATFMYKQVLSEAPWIDVIVRGEGEEIFRELIRAIDAGEWPENKKKIKGLAFRDGDEIMATQAASTVKDLDAINPDWSLLEWGKYIYVPLGVRVAIPNMARGCPFTCSFCSQWKFWRDYRVRDPKKVADEIETLVNEHDIGFFILADEEPTINRRKFIAFCQELIDRGLNKKVKWGINTRVTDIYRDRELLKFYREAGLVHVSLGTEAAAQLKLDQFNKETKVEENKEAIRLLREADIFVEAQFIVGLDNETPETLEETFQMAWDWQPDLANWAMYTPWPFTPLFAEIKDKVEVFDFSKYNFVTPIMSPEAMDRLDVAYTRFVSISKQQAVVETLLPLGKVDPGHPMPSLGEGRRQRSDTGFRGRSGSGRGCHRDSRRMPSKCRARRCPGPATPATACRPHRLLPASWAPAGLSPFGPPAHPPFGDERPHDGPRRGEEAPRRGDGGHRRPFGPSSVDLRGRPER